jgi:hypothetical protein
MAWIIRLPMMMLLAAVTVQDLKSRAVYWFWFPLLTALFITDLKMYHEQSLAEICQVAMINIGFVAVQLLLVSVYFSVKHRRWVNITNELLGWGDVLLLLSLSCYFSTLNYIFFYVFSLIIVLCIFITRSFIKKSYEHIPLAGLQALLVIVCIIASWCYPKIDITNDDWLQHLIYS